MKTGSIQTIVATALVGALLFSSAHAQQKTPGFNNKIPDEILTPDTVKTRIGELKYFDGLPTKETSQKLYDNLDFIRGVEAFLNFVPAASIEAIRTGSAGIGVKNSHQVLIFDQLADSNPLFLTANTDTVYAMAILDLQKDGPTVVEIPPGTGPGTVGRPGPDRGKGGDYLILPPGYTGDVPNGYYVGRSRTYINWIALRGFLVDGKPDAAAKSFRDGLKIYPLSQAKDLPAVWPARTMVRPNLEARRDRVGAVKPAPYDH